MRIEEAKDPSSERRFLIACVTSTPFLARVTSRLEKDPLRSTWSNIIWGWCSSHYEKYQQAPGKLIKDIFSDWANTNKDKDTQKLLDRFLVSLSSEEGEIQVEHALDQAEKFLNEIKLERLQEEISAKLSRGDVEGALETRDSFHKIELKAPAHIDVLTDKEAQRKVLDHKQKVLIKYPGPAGEFFGEELSQDSFVGVMASAKGGKSHLLLDMAWRAMRQGRRVAYFQIGDLSQNQIMGRFLERAAYRPMKAKTVKVPCGIVLPEARPNRPLAIVEYASKLYESPLSWKAAERAFLRIAGKSQGTIQLSCHPTKSVTVDGIKGILDRWDRDGLTCDVVIIDYAGNLSPRSWKANPIDQVSDNWAMMRQISEMRKCLVVTAQQANKESFRAWVLTRNNFAESKYILAHVTCFIGISMTDEEKRKQLVRYNFVVRREESFSETYCLYCASCLDVRSPIVVSCLPKWG
jgi:hypothetical protein